MSAFHTGSQHESPAPNTRMGTQDAAATPSASGRQGDAGPNMDLPPRRKNESSQHDAATLSEEPGTSCGGHIRISQIINQIRDDQRRIVELLEQKLQQEPDISEVARSLWGNPCDAWAGSETESKVPKGTTLGEEFLCSLAPLNNPKSLLETRGIFQEWVEKPRWYSSPWKMEYMVCPQDMDINSVNIQDLWPKSWSLDDDYISMRYAYPCSFDNPFVYKEHEVGSINTVPTVYEEGRLLSGIILRFIIDSSTRIIEFPAAAAILSTAKGKVYLPSGDPEFLAGHLEKWRERSTNHRCGLRQFETSYDFAPVTIYPGEFKYGAFMHFMRSFIVAKSGEGSDRHTGKLWGLKCNREQVSVQGFYSQDVVQLTERRYSVALSILPLVHPCGNFALTTVVDGEDRRIWQDAPGHFKDLSERSVWKKYDIHPAGLYTGVAMFQLEICWFIDYWEQDWIATIDRIDQLVSVKFDTLEQFDLLKKIVMNTKSDDSVSYFKVLQVLGLFSDSVRAAISYLDTLTTSVKNPYPWDCWFEKSYPHSDDTQRILQHNWSIVRRRQRDASAAILARLERTTGEVKSLRDGLFNVQSVVEAQKSRALNKYLMVFTIVTIAFLPPTFVATFYGMDLFHSSTTVATQKSFWAALAGVTSITYVMAAVGIFGSSIPKETRTEWLRSLRTRAEGMKEHLRRKKQQQKPDQSEV